MSKKLAAGAHNIVLDVKIGSGDTDGSTYFIEFDKLPRDVCVELGLKVWLVNDGSDLDVMKINNKTYAWKFSNSVNSSNYKLPANPNDVATGCNKEHDNKIVWYFN